VSDAREINLALRIFAPSGVPDEEFTLAMTTLFAVEGLRGKYGNGDSDGISYRKRRRISLAID
jgi:hypothetical protein